MIAGLSLGSDARRYFHFSLPRLAIVTVIQMPLLYGALYLWTFWNPFGGVDEGEGVLIGCIYSAIVDVIIGSLQSCRKAGIIEAYVLVDLFVFLVLQYTHQR